MAKTRQKKPDDTDLCLKSLVIYDIHSTSTLALELRPRVFLRHFLLGFGTPTLLRYLTLLLQGIYEHLRYPLHRHFLFPLLKNGLRLAHLRRKHFQVLGSYSLEQMV
jgi:hypothetical protein